MTKPNVIKIIVAIVLLSIGIGFLTAQLIVSNRLQESISEARVDIAEQKATVSALSEVMARGGVDTVTETVIKDCPSGERDRFDSLLSRLNGGIATFELQELSRLYDRCAAFYARRKAVMTARLEREVEVYELLTNRLKTVSHEEPTSDSQIQEWKELVGLEKSQTETFERLVALQGNILNELLKGGSAERPEIVKLLEEVKETYEMQTYNSVQMDEVRSTLSTL